MKRNKCYRKYGYGDIFSRENLDRKYRQIATIAALTALGNARPQLKFHIKAGLNVGLSEESIKEIMLLMTVYPGFRNRKYKNEFHSGFQPSEQGPDVDPPPLRDGAEIIRAFSPCMPCGP
ncbi:carboxymuconolactone decarboxylase family protein [Tannerella sp.]|uniref:carboxymuconolactone decarboxylase family protein n=1 Tax=Tannerella sp. TaxID=2382127 RepID=UPI0026DC2261|nr:carboxymuconolactone decarboxylase family protein [Tannerella sp.]MDO4702994.1 carboxymuconolactone decarboxylase family protein [Tannerella sp.]